MKITNFHPAAVFAGLAMGLALAPCAQANSIFAIPSLGGMNTAISQLNDSGQGTGYSNIAGDVEQHAFRLLADGTLEDLGTLGGSYSLGTAINNVGQVTGDASTTGNLEFHAFLHSNGTMTDLGTLGGSSSSATGINDNGEVTGNSFLTGNLESHAFLYSGGTIMDLGTLGGVSSSAYAINNLGEVVGESFMPGTYDSHPFLYSGGTMMDLGTLGGTFGVAWDINNNSVVVGESDNVNWEIHAFAVTGGVMADLGTLGGTFSTAISVNDAGQIIGDSMTTGDIEYHGFVFMGGAMTDLGTLGGSFTTAVAINNSGQIVGDSTDITEMMYPFLWDNGTMVDVNTLLPPNSGWELWSALHINDLGQISGYGLLDGEFRYYLLTMETQDPNQAPVAMAGPDQAFQCPRSVTLDGTLSSDPDGDPLSYDWSQNGVVVATGPNPSVNLPAFGLYLFDLTVTDPDGSSSTDSISVNIQDTIPPNVSCPINVMASANEDCLVAVPDLTMRALASDNCTDSLLLTRTQSPAPGTMVGVGQYDVTVTVSDTSGNEGSCVTLLTVSDGTAPQVVCPAPSQAPAAGDLNQAPAPDLASVVQATDNCSSQDQLSVTQSPAPGTMLSLGIHQITVNVSDQAGNQSSCVSTFAVVDVTAPVVVAPEGAVVEPNADGLGTVPDFLENLEATDNATPNEQLVLEQNPAAGTLLPPGSFLVAIVVRDLAGNASTVSTSLTVLEPCKLVVVSVDAIPSELSPANHKMIPVVITVNAESTCGEVVSKIISVSSSEPVIGGKDKTSPDWEITGALTVDLRAERASNKSSRYYTVVVESRDPSGNISQDSVTVSVLKKNSGTASAETTGTNSSTSTSKSKKK